jgi:two-component system, LuxR family, response regulator FixJ
MYMTEEFSAQADLFAPDPGATGAATGRGDPHLPIVAVIDDDEAARRSTAWFLEGEGYRVLCFASGDAFLAARLPQRLACALLDLRMPGRNGLDVLRALGERDDAPPTLVLTGHADLSIAIAAMKLNAIDLIEKPYAPEALLRALEAAAAQRERSRAARAAGRAVALKVDALSERQRQVLVGIVRGRANKMIAWDLGLSIRTVEAYRAQLFQKLRVRSTAEAVRIAVAAGLDRSGED